MIFSRIIAGVDQSIRRSTRKPRLNQDENRWTKSASTAGKVVAVVERIDQLLAHPHQRGGAVGREVEPPQQLLPARLGGNMDLGRGLVGRVGLPGRDRGIEPRMVRAEAIGQRLEEGDARAGGQLGIFGKNLARQRDAGRFAAAGQQFLAQLGQAFGARLGLPAAVAGPVQQRAAALRDAGQHFAEEGGVHSGQARSRCTRGGDFSGYVQGITTVQSRGRSSRGRCRGLDKMPLARHRFRPLALF